MVRSDHFKSAVVVEAERSWRTNTGEVVTRECPDGTTPSVNRRLGVMQCYGGCGRTIALLLILRPYPLNLTRKWQDNVRHLTLIVVQGLI